MIGKEEIHPILKTYLDKNIQTLDARIKKGRKQKKKISPFKEAKRKFIDLMGVVDDIEDFGTLTRVMHQTESLARQYGLKEDRTYALMKGYFDTVRMRCFKEAMKE